MRSLFTFMTSSKIYTLSLHDALPICMTAVVAAAGAFSSAIPLPLSNAPTRTIETIEPNRLCEIMAAPDMRSEEHTSELQSRRDLVCRLLLEKKNNTFADWT